MDELVKILSGHAFLNGLQSHHLTLLAGLAKITRIYTNQYVFREGMPAEQCFLVLSGGVMLETETPGKDALPVQAIEAGEVLGCSWLCPPFRWRFDARAIKPTQMLGLDAARLRKLCDEDHELGYQMMLRITKKIFERLESTRFQLLDLHERSAAPSVAES